MVSTPLTFSLDHLNPEQKKAAEFASGVALVVAGAGSGKTRVITSRIAHLMANMGCQADQIIALTFTNKAAQEMKERIAHFLPNVKRLPFVGTFHGYCLQFLKQYKHQLGFDTFGIIDAEDQKALLKKIIDRHGLDKRVNTTQVHYAISLLKNGAPATSTNPTQSALVQQIYQEYEREKKQLNVVDFDDLLTITKDFLSSHPEVRMQHQHNLQHILVDEYQDTNIVQHQLLKLLALTPEDTLHATSVCAVGDEDQSIYSWRGANVENMNKFVSDFSPVTTIKIEQNYRSAQSILDVANALIAKNSRRVQKNLWSAKKLPNRVMVALAKSGYHEAAVAVTALKSKPEQIPLNQCAILYRTHAQSRALEEQLIQQGVPYTIFGGLRFYERKEIKDLLAFMRLLANPRDRISLLRVLNTPGRGLGEKIENLLHDIFASNIGISWQQALKQLLAERAEHGLSKVHVHGLESFLALYDGLTFETSLTMIYQRIIERSEYLAYLGQAFEQEEARAKAENIREFYHSLKFFEEKNSELEGSLLENFLHEVALLQEKIDAASPASTTVQLMTLHSAKGLEFDFVIVTGLEEEVLPSSRALQENRELEEERRLCYVGMTRAKEYLLLTYAQTRNSYGNYSHQEVSRFIKELPSMLYTRLDASGMYQSAIDNALCAWFGSKATYDSTLFEQPTFINNPAKRDFELKKITKPTPSNTSQKAMDDLKRILEQRDKAARLEKSENANSARAPAATNKLPWKINQSVLHDKFGSGKVVSVEERSTDQFFVTVKFGSGTKRILSSFLKPT